jgi:hypothetical protein
MYRHRGTSGPTEYGMCHVGVVRTEPNLPPDALIKTPAGRSVGQGDQGLLDTGSPGKLRVV